MGCVAQKSSRHTQTQRFSVIMTYATAQNDRAPVVQGVPVQGTLPVDSALATPVQATLVQSVHHGAVDAPAYPAPPSSSKPVLLTVRAVKPTARTPLGVTVAKVSHSYRKTINVCNVQPGGLASIVGIQPGDSIVAVNGCNIRHLSQCLSLLREATGTVTIVLRRGGSTQYGLRRRRVGAAGAIAGGILLACLIL